MLVFLLLTFRMYFWLLGTTALFTRWLGILTICPQFSWRSILLVIWKRSNEVVFHKKAKPYFKAKADPLNFVLHRRNHLEVLCKKAGLKDFAKLTGKHLCQSLFFNKVLKRDSGTGDFLWVFRTAFFIENLRWLHLLAAKCLQQL